MRTWIKSKLPALALLHPKNKLKSYPQLWYCWPRWTRRIRFIYKIRTSLCWLLTGHEISKTEWGYGGGKYADCNCRWCDKSIQVPIQESPAPSPILEDLAKFLPDNKNDA